MQALRLGEQEMFTNLCQVFGISPAVAGPNRRDSLAVLGLLFVMPSIEDRMERRKLGNMILKAAHEAVPPLGSASISQFQHQVAGHVVMMQAFPEFHGNLRHSEQNLSRKHKICTQVIRVLKVLGIGAGTTAAGSAMGSYVETKSVKAAAGVGLRRLAGMGDFTDALRKRAGASAGGAASNAISIAVVAIATAAYLSASRNIVEIEHIADHRFKSGGLSESAYQTLFPKVDPFGIERYWEY